MESQGHDKKSMNQEENRSPYQNHLKENLHVNMSLPKCPT